MDLLKPHKHKPLGYIDVRHFSKVVPHTQWLKNSVETVKTLSKPLHFLRQNHSKGIKLLPGCILPGGKGGGPPPTPCGAPADGGIPIEGGIDGGIDPGGGTGGNAPGGGRPAHTQKEETT